MNPITVTVGSLVGDVVATGASVVPELGIFIAAGAVVSLAAVAVRRFVKSAR